MAVTIGSVTEGNANAEEIKNNSPDSELYENNKKYLQGSLVKFNDKIYLAKRNVPSDVDLDNPYYWEIFMDAADSKRVDELFEKAGNLNELETESKDNLVNAINEAVLYTAQSLTEEQQAQARANIGAGTPYTLPQATAEAIGGVKADSAEAADTQPVRIGVDGKLYTAAGGTDISLGLTSASVGQTIKVKAIDESGKPTEWEAADMPSGGGHWETVLEKPFDTIDGNTLVNRSGTLCVNTTDDAEQDNTRPITSSGVHVICGNINALLQAI